jgi:hypothetical protein
MESMRYSSFYAAFGGENWIIFLIVATEPESNLYFWSSSRTFSPFEVEGYVTKSLSVIDGDTCLCISASNRNEYQKQKNNYVSGE